MVNSNAVAFFIYFLQKYREKYKLFRGMKMNENERETEKMSMFSGVQCIQKQPFAQFLVTKMTYYTKGENCKMAAQLMMAAQNKNN